MLLSNCAATIPIIVTKMAYPHGPYFFILGDECINKLRNASFHAREITKAIEPTNIAKLIKENSFCFISGGTIVYECIFLGKVEIHVQHIHPNSMEIGR